MTSHTKNITLLSKIDCFADLSESELNTLSSLCQPQRLKAGEALFHEGDAGDAVYVVSHGRLRIHMLSQEGECVTLGEIGPGETLGEISALDGSPRTASATAVSTTQLLAIPRTAFLDFLEMVPRLAVHLLKLSAARMRHKTDLFREINRSVPAITQVGDPMNQPQFQVTLVGYGRYGKNYIGPKYAKSGFPWEVTSIIDPNLTQGQYLGSVLGQHKPNVKIYPSFAAWQLDYFNQLSEDERPRQAVELALKPDSIFNEAMRFIQAGVQQLILPKPVVTDQRQLDWLSEAALAARVKTAVASQWFYSDLPRIIQREINLLTNGTKALERVTMNFSKENGLAYTTPPPLLELPHVLQLLISCGLINPSSQLPRVNGTEAMVRVGYPSPTIREGVYIMADIDMQPDAAVKARYPNWDVQERTLKIYRLGQAETEPPALEVDFWVKYDRSGDIALRPGKLIIRPEASGNSPIMLNFVEDQLLNMNQKIYAAFCADFDTFQVDPNVLSLERYHTIGRQIMFIQQAWAALTAAKLPLPPPPRPTATPSRPRPISQHFPTPTPV